MSRGIREGGRSLSLHAGGQHTIPCPHASAFKDICVGLTSSTPCIPWCLVNSITMGGCEEGNGKSPGAHCMGAFTEQGHPPSSTQTEPSDSSHTGHKAVKASLTIQAISEQEA